MKKQTPMPKKRSWIAEDEKKYSPKKHLDREDTKKRRKQNTTTATLH